MPLCVQFVSQAGRDPAGTISWCSPLGCAAPQAALALALEAEGVGPV